LRSDIIAEKDVSVVHLVRKAEGWKDSFKLFFDSFDKYTGELPQALVIACKNLSTADLEWIRGVSRTMKTELVTVEDKNFDLGSYYTISLGLKTDYALFLNSNSLIQCDYWFERFLTAINSNSSLEMIGATSSFASNKIRAPMPSSGILDVIDWPIRLGKKLLIHCLGGYRYPAFPNPHIRTNAFLIKIDLYREFVEEAGMPRTKSDTHLMESGFNSLTNFVLDRGFDVGVASRKGECFSPAMWADSHTYCVPGQRGLLVADNQTEIYANANSLDMRVLEYETWGAVRGRS
jgi:hypothetical protein